MTANNNQNVAVYQKQFKELLQAVFGHQAVFRDFFGGGLEALDGVRENETAFYVKTSDIPVVIQDYSTDENVAFGTGTSNSNRFGERNEIIYQDTPVNYTWTWAFHEGIDRFTVNNNLDKALADRLDLQAQAKVEMFNQHHAEFISASAGHTEALADFTNDAVLTLFNDLSRYFTNNKVIGNRVANVNTELYNAIVNHPIMTTAKHSQTNIDSNNVVRFKNFEIVETADDYFAEGDVAYAYVRNVAKAFTGINTTRTIASEDFDGIALQGAGKAGEFITEDNKKAVVKVTGGTAGV